MPFLQLWTWTDGAALESPSPLPPHAASFVCDCASRDGERFNKTSDYYYRPADRSGGHHGSDTRCGSVCGSRLHVDFCNSAILTADLHIVVTRAQQYRAKAAECDQRAATALSPDIKEQFEELAHQWRDMADQIDRMFSGRR